MYLSTQHHAFNRKLYSRETMTFISQELYGNPACMDSFSSFLGLYLTQLRVLSPSPRPRPAHRMVTPTQLQWPSASPTLAGAVYPQSKRVNVLPGPGPHLGGAHHPVSEVGHVDQLPPCGLILKRDTVGGRGCSELLTPLCGSLG